MCNLEIYELCCDKALGIEQKKFGAKWTSIKIVWTCLLKKKKELCINMLTYLKTSFLPTRSFDGKSVNRPGFKNPTVYLAVYVAYFVFFINWGTMHADLVMMYSGHFDLPSWTKILLQNLFRFFFCFYLCTKEVDQMEKKVIFVWLKDLFT